jgi:Sulfotransferase family
VPLRDSVPGTSDRRSQTRTAMAGSPTVFLHVPRTGGTSIEHLLRAMYPGSHHVCDDPAPSAIAATLRRYRSVRIHVGTIDGEMFYFTREIMREPNWDLLRRALVFVLFRDPTKQFISTYRYLHRVRNQVEPAFVKSGVRFPVSIHDWMNVPLAYNIQLAFLVGKLQHPGGVMVDRSDLEFAKRLLRELNVRVGITERFAESLHLLETGTGSIIPNRTIQVRNTTSDHPPERYDEATMRCIAEGNALDRELYEYALALFEVQLAACGPVPQYRFQPDTGSL